MATQSTVTGPVQTPFGATPDRGYIRFQLTDWDAEGGTVITTTAVEEPIDVDTQDFSASLWASSEGDRGVNYKVTAVWYYSTVDKWVEDEIGYCEVGTSGPYALGDILVDDPIYPADIDYATAAATSAAEAAGYAADAALYDGPKYDSFADMIADGATFAAGTQIQIPSIGAVYEATDGTGNLGQVNAGGQEFDVLPDGEGYVTFAQLGAVGDGVTDDRHAFVAAYGRKVRGEAGATYYIDIGGTAGAALAYEDTLAPTAGTTWEMNGAKILWDYVGAPLFFFARDASDVTITDPEIIWDGTVPDTDPVQSDFDESSLNSYFDASLGRGASITTMLVQCPDDLSIVRPKFYSANPGPQKSVFAHFKIDTNTAEEEGSNLQIIDPDLSDYCMGILGGRYDGIYIGPSVTLRRYDDYGDLAFSSAPGHGIYLTKQGVAGDGNSNVHIGHVYDYGDYQGTTTGANGFSCVKPNEVTNLRIDSITSFRPHGAYEGVSNKNVSCGPVWWRSDVGDADASYLSPYAFSEATSTTSGKTSNDCTFESVSLIVPNLDTNAPSTIARVGSDLYSSVGTTNVVVENMYIKTGASSATSLVTFRNTDKCVIKRLCYDVPDGSTLNASTFGDENTNSGVSKLDSVGGGKATDVSILSGSINSSCFVTFGGFDPLSPDVGLIDQGSAEGVFVFTEGQVLQGKLTRDTTADTAQSVSVTLPSEGVWKVWLLVYNTNKADSESIEQEYTVVNWPTVPLQRVTQVGSDVVLGTDLASVGLSLTGDPGVLTIDTTLNVSARCEYYFSASKVASLNLE